MLWAAWNAFRFVSRKLRILVSMYTFLAGSTATFSIEIGAHMSPLCFSSFYANYALGGNSSFTFCNIRKRKTQPSLCLRTLLSWQAFNRLSNLKDAVVIMTNSLRCSGETWISITYFWKTRQGKYRSGDNPRKNNLSLWTIDRPQNLLPWPWERLGRGKVFSKEAPPSFVSRCFFGSMTFIGLFVLTFKMLFFVLS